MVFEAAEVVVLNLDHHMQHMLVMRDALEQSLRQTFPPDGPVRVIIFGQDRCVPASVHSRGTDFSAVCRRLGGRLPNTVNVAFVGPSCLNGEFLLNHVCCFVCFFNWKQSGMH
ncbi:unnamed protein product [Echinostoma caproni]|uniref:Mediator of RNA polymerase II transcription subunit 25 n=1 Tax=Echinostoma caproni TaxID=27848 RepID=A0A183AIK2_9TREM|nr:unnamed protein product [Echinostoma caproni]